MEAIPRAVQVHPIVVPTRDRELGRVPWRGPNANEGAVPSHDVRPRAWHRFSQCETSSAG